ncbi:nucleotide sugar dehydrogenase [Paramagnetospirillum marisnigri]|uniref:Nucleotide sugar dehydrogenase n=1 Tax=Paramagnetospirillum marisnigri TaxID=1285242 RepID=A0A178MND7_9PROT|nr:nucleotide sugar dehydrogenase [Paramagnetospirillum marisnigri]OAN50292.1 nucleotide sugar dehydrogenase [Paramagnetospirillum marisnigri]
MGNNKVADGIDVTVIGGAGHVGLPLALCFADKGLRVLVQDINQAALDVIASGRMPALEYDAQPYLDRALASGRFHMSSRPEDIPATGAVIITIGTPVDEYLNPVHKAVKACLDAILPRLVDGQLVILRSTVFPGTTDWLHHYLEEQGRKLLVAFCPERVVQGFAIRELQNMPQIVSGTTPEAEEAAAKLFGLLASDVVRVKPMEAEFAKLFNNAYRYIQFAATNQFFMIANSAGVNYHAIHDAMTRDYPRAKDMPRPGFSAGPCLFKDTMQLAAFSNNQFSLGHMAMLVNEGLILYIIQQAEKRFDLKRSTVGLLGMAFKAEVDDIRASLSYKLKKMLTLKAKTVLTTDPFVTDDPDLVGLDEVLDKSDVLMLCTPHSAYRGLDLKGKPVIDVWGMLDMGGI